MSKVHLPRMTFGRGAALCMACTGTISLLAGAGWLFNRPVLASFNPNFIPMAPATALIFLGLCGAWVLQRIFPDRRWIRTLVQAALVGMFIIVIFLALRYFTGLGPDLEKILYPAPPMFGQFSSARMSPLSALGFFLAIVALLLLTGGKPGQQLRSISAALSLALFVLSSLICLGYLYGAPPFYGGTLTPVAITSALSFLFLSLGLLVTVGPSGWPIRVFIGHSLRARLMRTFIPAALLIVLLQGFLSTAADPWVINPAIKVAVAALVALLTVVLLISLIANALGADIDRGRKAEQALVKSETELRALFAGMTDVVIVLDIDGRYIEIAPTNPANLYRPPDEMLGKTMHDILPKEQADYVLSMIHSSIHNGQVMSGEYALQINGKDTYFSASVSRLSESTAILVAHDITNRKQFELVQNAIYRITQATITSEGMDALYGSIHSILGELIPAKNFYIAIYDPLNRLISFPYFVDQSDEQPSAPTKLQGPTGYVIRTGRPLLASREIFDRLVGLGELEAVGTVGVDWMGSPLKGEAGVIGVMAMKSYSEGIRFNQKDLNLLEFVSTQVAQAIERKRMEEEIRSLSLTDELTGLYNRRGFTLLAEHEVKQARREKRDMLLMFGDMDGLKTINDTHGHAQGDLALQEISALLKTSLREADILARYGGDEFVALAVDASLENADLLSMRIQAALEAHNQEANQPFQLLLSTGIVCYDPETDCTISEMIAQADAQMYADKQTRKRKKGIRGAVP